MATDELSGVSPPQLTSLGSANSRDSLPEPNARTDKKRPVRRKGTPRQPAAQDVDFEHPEHELDSIA